MHDPVMHFKIMSMYVLISINSFSGFWSGVECRRIGEEQKETINVELEWINIMAIKMLKCADKGVSECLLWFSVSYEFEEGGETEQGITRMTKEGAERRRNKRGIEGMRNNERRTTSMQGKERWLKKPAMEKL